MKAHAPSLLKCAEPRWPVLLPCSALQNDLSNRLRPDPGIGTAAVLLSDDDLLLRCACLTCTKWQLSGVCGARCCLPAAFCRVQPQQQQWCSTLPPAPTPSLQMCRRGASVCQVAGQPAGTGGVLSPPWHTRPAATGAHSVPATMAGRRAVPALLASQRSAPPGKPWLVTCPPARLPACPPAHPLALPAVPWREGSVQQAVPAVQPAAHRRRVCLS